MIAVTGVAPGALVGDATDAASESLAASAFSLAAFSLAASSLAAFSLAAFSLAAFSLAAFSLAALALAVPGEGLDAVEADELLDAPEVAEDGDDDADDVPGGDDPEDDDPEDGAEAAGVCEGEVGTTALFGTTAADGVGFGCATGAGSGVGPAARTGEAPTMTATTPTARRLKRPVVTGNAPQRTLVPLSPVPAATAA